MPKKGMHYANVETSPRLQRVLSILQDGLLHSTREIARVADVCAVNSIMEELRRNGFSIMPAKKMNGAFYYRLAQSEAV